LIDIVRLGLLLFPLRGGAMALAVLIAVYSIAGGEYCPVHRTTTSSLACQGVAFEIFELRKKCA